MHRPKKNKGDLDEKVLYNARDSIRMDAALRKVYLYGDASVKYTNLELKAAYIEIELDSNIAIARGAHDSGKIVGNPEFHEGTDIFYAKQIRYNFKTKKGRINQIHTKEGEGYVTGKIVKKDSSGVFFMKEGTYSTCDKDSDKDFYIGALKLKVIPHDQVITGPAWLVIEGVPTPLAIPFGFFPLQQGRHSGILIPAYGESQSEGFFLQNGGYYFGLSDHLDDALQGDIYSYGSWGLRNTFNYSDRYHYAGIFKLGYALTELPISGTTETSKSKNFNINWQDNQDPKARPNSTFMASVNAGSANYYSFTSYTPSTMIQNTLSSNISYTQNFPETPFHLSLNAEHSQNTITKQIDITLPELTFTADRMYPAKWFEDQDAPFNSNKWYNNISFTISTSAENKISTTDSLLFKPATLKQMQNGSSTTIPLSGNFRVLKYFTLTPTISVTTTEYLQTYREQWNPQDSIIDTTIRRGLQMANTYQASATLTTNIYSLYSLGMTKGIMIRDVIIPSFGFSYHPDYGSSNYGYYRQVTNAPTPTEYSIFQNELYAGPGQGKSGAINMSLGNNLEMKIRQHTDSGVVYKKIKLLERFTIGASYNLAADSFKWSNISLSGNTTLFKKLAVNYSGALDPYYTYSTGADRPELSWDNDQFPRFVSNNLSFSTTLTPGGGAQKQTAPGTNNAITSSGANSATNTTTNSTTTGPQFTSPNDYFTYINNRPAYYAPLELNSWSITLNYSLISSVSLLQKTTEQTVNINASAQITKYWYASIYTGYDFVGHQFSATSLSFKRDLHCWELLFNTIPFGYHQNFSVEVHVKSSVLKDLKLSRQRDWEDTQQYQQ